MVMKRIGERAYHCPLILELPSGEAGEPTVIAMLDIVDGEMQVRSVTIAVSEGGEQMRQRHVRAISLGELEEAAVKKFGMKVVRGRRGGKKFVLLQMSGEPQSPESNRRNYRQQRRADLLAVSRVYAAADHAPTKAVAGHFGVKRRTASSYVKQARDAGFLPPSIRTGTRTRG